MSRYNLSIAPFQGFAKACFAKAYFAQLYAANWCFLALRKAHLLARARCREFAGSCRARVRQDAAFLTSRFCFASHLRQRFAREFSHRATALANAARASFRQGFVTVVNLYRSA